MKVKGTKVRARSNPDAEPDFWNLPFVPLDDGALAHKRIIVPAAAAAASVSPPSLASAPRCIIQQARILQQRDEMMEEQPMPDAAKQSSSIDVPDEVTVQGWENLFNFFETFKAPEEDNDVMDPTPVRVPPPVLQPPAPIGTSAAPVLMSDPFMDDFLDTMSFDQLVHDIFGNDMSFADMLDRAAE